MFFVGGSGVSTVVGGSGQNTMFGGSSGRDLLVAGVGLTTIVGFNGNSLVGLGTNPDVLVSGGGNETLVGSAQGEADKLFANNGNDAMFGGTGNDTLVAAGGNAQMIAGSGSDLFLFSNGNAGGVAVIWNFAQGQDHVELYNYGPKVVDAILNSAVVNTGGTTVTLPDNTRITFADITHLSANDFV